MPSPPPIATRFPLRVAIRRTGLSADLLRAWERRYGAVEPHRSPGGQRLYSEADLERLTLLRQVTAAGHGIGQVARLAEPELRALLAEPAGEPSRASTGSGGGESLERVRRLALASVVDLDDEGLETLLRRVIRSEGAFTAIEEVVVPVMREVGERWHRRALSPAHEHLATAVVTRTLHWLLDVPRVGPGAPRLAVATTQGERHELGALVVAVVGAFEGWRVITLGADLPATAIVSAVGATGAGVLALSYASVHAAREALPDLGLIRSALPPASLLLVGGAGAVAMADELDAIGCVVVDRLPALRAHLARVADAAPRP